MTDLSLNSEVEPATAIDPDLRTATFAGVRWITTARFAAEAAVFFSALILARLLSPTEFGHAAIAVILLPLSVLLSFEGFGAALVQRHEIDDALLRAATTMSWLFGATMTVATYLLAPLVAKPLFGNETTELIQLISLVFVLGGLVAVPRAVLQRDLRFRRLAVIELIGLAGGTAVSLSLALANMGAGAIVAGALASATLSVPLMFASVPRPRLGWDSSRNREILGFGLPASLTALGYMGRTNADYAIIGATLGSAATGLYWRAFQIGVEYQGKVSSIMARVAFPVLSRAGGRQDMLELRARMTRVTAVLLFPVLALVMITAPVLVPWLFGPQWHGAVVPVQILVVAGMAQCAAAGHAQVMFAAGMPQTVMVFQFASLAALVAVVLAALPLGVIGVSAAVAGLNVVMLLAIYRYLLQKKLSDDPSAMTRDLLPAIIPTVLLLVATFPIFEWLRPKGLPTFLLLSSVSVAGLVIYCFALHRMFPAASQDVKRLIRGVVPSRLKRRRVSPLGKISTADR